MIVLFKTSQLMPNNTVHPQKTILLEIVHCAVYYLLLYSLVGIYKLSNYICIVIAWVMHSFLLHFRREETNFDLAQRN